MAENLRVGVFRAAFGDGFPLLEANSGARRLFGLDDETELPTLARVLDAEGQLGRVDRRSSTRGGAGPRHRHRLARRGPPGAASPPLVRDEDGEPAFIDGLLVDVTAARDAAAGREVQQLRASMLFLHEPVARLRHQAIVVGMGEQLGEVAERMTGDDASAALVASDFGAIIGILTDHDMRARVAAAGRALDQPVETVMTAPLVRIRDSAPVYAALLRMEEHDQLPCA